MHGPRLRSVWRFRYLGRFNGYCRPLKAMQEGLPNIWHDEGEEFAIKVLFNETLSVPANYYIGLDNRGSLAEDDTLPPTGEPTGTGYARQAVASDDTDFTASQVAGNWQTKTKEVTFTAGAGGWTQVSNMFICTTSDDTGKLLCSVPMSASYTLADGESLKVDMTITCK